MIMALLGQLSKPANQLIVTLSGQKFSVLLRVDLDFSDHLCSNGRSNI
jgi:hypothetical protein